MISNGLVTPAVLGPWLQITLRGLMTGMTVDEALLIKFLVTLDHILALWALLRLLWLLPLAILLAVPL